ncbi:expressed unknown protein [Seminavis robusta]|uniref:Uncharacterized protein n=1 Tax=Seminavis robusta TaxID=568900 RepID=A0A9N8H8A1_9STRA|nr:expressed unknown protein [Seminavis robusta]|eukprot:Sro232_g093960.1 n/a (397) ;mRNA; f:60491-61681
MKDARTSNSRYVDAVLQGIHRSIQHYGRDGWTLQKLQIQSYFELNRAQMDKLLWVAPKELELCIHAHLEEEEPEQGGTCTRDWSMCGLQTLSFDYYSELDDAAFVALLETLSKLSSLQSLSLNACPEGEEPLEDIEGVGFNREKITGPLVQVLENNPNIHYLQLCTFLPEAGPFCDQLQRCNNLKKIHLKQLKSVEEGGDLRYFELLFAALSSKDLIVDELKYEYMDSDETNETPWGPSGVMYPIALNKGGLRQKMVDESINSKELFNMLTPLCSSEAERETRRAAMMEMVSSELADYDRAKKEHALGNSDHRLLFQASFTSGMMVPYVASRYGNKPMQDLKDTCMIYGLLRQSPAIWLKMANNDQEEDAKPKARKCPATQGKAGPTRKKPKQSTT